MVCVTFVHCRRMLSGYIVCGGHGQPSVKHLIGQLFISGRFQPLWAELRRWSVGAWHLL